MDYKTSYALLNMASPVVNGKTVAVALICGDVLDAQACFLNTFALSALRKEHDETYPISDLLVMKDIVNTLSPYLSDQRLFDLNTALCKSETQSDSQQAFRTSRFARFFMYEEMRRELQETENKALGSRFLYHYQHQIKPNVNENFKGSRDNELRFVSFNFLKEFGIYNADTILDAKEMDEPPKLNKTANKSLADLETEFSDARAKFGDVGAPLSAKDNAGLMSSTTSTRGLGFFAGQSAVHSVSEPKRLSKPEGSADQISAIKEMIVELEGKYVAYVQTLQALQDGSSNANEQEVILDKMKNLRSKIDALEKKVGGAHEVTGSPAGKSLDMK